MEEKEEIKKDVSVETRTIEQLLKDLREAKGWSYWNVIEELNKLGIVTDVKLMKKWEIGLEYPDLDAIYKLSELYMVPSKDFIKAKGNSYEQGYNSIHMTIIKWFCYLTGLSFKIGAVFVVLIYVFGLTFAVWFFLDKVDMFMQVRGVK